MQINISGLQQTGLPGYYQLIYILMKSWFFIQNPVLPTLKLKFDSVNKNMR